MSKHNPVSIARDSQLPSQEGVLDCLKTVFDPEFPLVDIWTMGLIYDIRILHKEKTPTETQNSEGSWDEEGFVSYDDRGVIKIDMTLTTPACPAADYLPEQAKQSVQMMYPDYQVDLQLVRDPTRTVAMIKDEDLKRMFE